MNLSGFTFLFIYLLMLTTISCENNKRLKPKVNLTLHFTFKTFQPKIKVTYNNKNISRNDIDLQTSNFEFNLMNVVYSVEQNELVNITVEDEFNEVRYFTFKSSQSDTINIDLLSSKEAPVDYFMMNKTHDSLSILAEFTLYNLVNHELIQCIYRVDLFIDSCGLRSTLWGINYFVNTSKKNIQQLNSSFCDSINQVISGCTNRFSSRIYCIPHEKVYLTLKKGNYIYRCDKMTPEDGLKFDQLYRIIRRLHGVKVRGKDYWF
jgi:hypothetical protein